jgi:hypothetical protein
MTSKEMNKLLTRFANDSVLATHIDVDIGEHYHSYKAKLGHSAYYGDCNELVNRVHGAQDLLWWLERNNYKIVKRRRNANQD